MPIFREPREDGVSEKYVREIIEQGVRAHRFKDLVEEAYENLAGAKFRGVAISDKERLMCSILVVKEGCMNPFFAKEEKKALERLSKNVRQWLNEQSCKDESFWKKVGVHLSATFFATLILWGVSFYIHMKDRVDPEPGSDQAAHYGEKAADLANKGGPAKGPNDSADESTISGHTRSPTPPKAIGAVPEP